MIRSSVDLGTNTCLLLVVEMRDRRIEKTLGDFATVVRLGQEVDAQRKLHPEAMRRTLECLKRYAAELEELGGDPARTVCVATSQARDASNGPEFFQTVEKETGFRFRVISGEQEGKASFLGALLPGCDPESTAVIDIGGGSTEFITRRSAISLDIGSVRFTERYLKSDPVTDAEFWECQDAIDRELESAQPWRSRQTDSNTALLAVAGTATTLAAWFLGLEAFDASAIDEVTLTCGDLHRMVEELKWRTSEERAALAGVEKMRADVLLAGAMILWRSMERLGFRRLRVSTRGLRYGVLLEGF